MSAYVELEKFIRGVESLADMPETVAKEAEEGILDAARASANAATAPSGEAWADREAGGKALRGAAAAIEAKVSKNGITLRIGPPYVFHHYGAGGSSTTKAAESARARSERKREESGTRNRFHAPKRQILPEPGDPLPATMSKAIEVAAKRVFDRATGGR